MIEFPEDEAVISLYCYKIGPGQDSTLLGKINSWNIGGKGSNAPALVQHIKDLLGVT